MLYQLFEQSLWPTPIGARLASPPFPNGPSIVTQNARLSKNYKLVSAPGPLFDALVALPLGRPCTKGASGSEPTRDHSVKVNHGSETYCMLI